MTREEAKALLLNISAYDIDTQRGTKKDVKRQKVRVRNEKNYNFTGNNAVCNVRLH